MYRTTTNSNTGKILRDAQAPSNDRDGPISVHQAKCVLLELRCVVFTSSRGLLVHGSPRRTSLGPYFWCPHFGGTSDKYLIQLRSYRLLPAIICRSTQAGSAKCGQGVNLRHSAFDTMPTSSPSSSTTALPEAVESFLGHAFEEAT